MPLDLPQDAEKGLGHWWSTSPHHNIKTTRLSDKLDLKKIGPFKVKRNIRNVSFEFKLPPTMRIYFIFHISLLEPAHPDIFKDLAPELDPEI
jgi:hypothetical protein